MAWAPARPAADGLDGLFVRWSDRKSAEDDDHMRGAPEPRAAIARGLQAEKSPVPLRIVSKTDVLELELGLTPFPFRRPGQMRFIELLPKSGDFERVARRKENAESHRTADHRAISSALLIVPG